MNLRIILPHHGNCFGWFLIVLMYGNDNFCQIIQSGFKRPILAGKCCRWSFVFGRIFKQNSVQKGFDVCYRSLILPLNAFSHLLFWTDFCLQVALFEVTQNKTGALELNSVSQEVLRFVTSDHHIWGVCLKSTRLHNKFNGCCFQNRTSAFLDLVQ